MAAKRSSASARALKARLRILRRPTLWGSLLILLLPLLILSEYWQHPDKFTVANSNAASDSTANPSAPEALPTVSDASTILDLPDAADLSAPNGSTAASPTLKTDLLTALLSNSPSNAAKKQPVAPLKSQSQLRSSRNAFSAPPVEPATVDLTGIRADVAPTSVVQPSSIQPLLGSAAQVNSLDQTAPTSANPLQQAIGRILGQPESGDQATSQPSAQASPQASPQTGETAQATQAAPNPTFNTYGQPNPALLPSTGSSFSQPSSQPYVPQTSPAPGTTGYTLPPAFRTTTNTPSYPNSPSSLSTPQLAPTVRTQPVPGSPYVGSYGNTPGYGTTAPSPMPSYPAPSYASPQPQGQTPFSVPRTPPGRYIGGGEINTFSNP